LNNSIIKVDEIAATPSSTFSSLGSWSTQDITSLNNQIDGIYNKYSPLTLQSPNPLNPTTQIKPLYASVIITI